jgi:Cu-Zn family superoxide dismutase
MILLITIMGCKGEADKPQVFMEPEAAAFQKAVAVIHPLNESGVTGIVYFNQVQNGIEIIANIDGLEPGKHGFHIHEYGDLRAGDGTSAGGHFNPYDMPHGAPDASVRHAGDLGNIVAIADTTAYFKWVDTLISFTGESSVIGRAVIIHQDEDDFLTPPAGNAGRRIGAGVIGIANENL